MKCEDCDQGFEGVENAAAAKAEIVDALKSVCLDLQYGEKITEILNKSPIWAQYRDQRHDLFLPAQRTQAIAGVLALPFNLKGQGFGWCCFCYYHL